MNAIIMEKGEKLFVLSIPDELGVPDKIIHNYACSCGSVHRSILRWVGMHDDGEIYSLQEGDFHK